MLAAKRKKYISILLLVAMIVSMLPAGFGSAAEGDARPKLLITELVPDSANVSSADAYEFIEIYNHSDEAINFKNYELRYRYSTTDSLWSVGNTYESMVIPPHEAIVIWVTTEALNSKTTIDMFNANYNTNLVDGVSLFKLETSGGMSNAGPRTLAIIDPTVLDAQGKGTVIAQASYENDDQTKPDKGIFYRMPNAGSTGMVMMDNPGTVNATPGIIDSEQLLRLDETNNILPISISHTPSSNRVMANSDVVLHVTVNNAQSTVIGQVYYKFDDATGYETLEMTGSLTDLSATITSDQLASHSKLTYYIEVSGDDQGAVTTDPYEITIVTENEENVDAPALLVTELLPNSSNKGSGDAYEFIEIYNNTDQDINFKDYKLFYIYTDSGRTADVMWPSAVEDITIKSMDTMVFWVINSYNSDLTVADFNREFNTNLIENVNIVKLYSDGMANSSRRGIAIGTNTHQDISIGYYDGTKSNVANKGSHYQYVAGQTVMNEYAVGTILASPGYVAPEQVPAVPLKVELDTEAPQFTNTTGLSEISELEDLTLQATITDDQSLKTAILYYKTDKDNNYNKRYLYDEANSGQFSYTINSSELIGREELSYYFEYSDGTYGEQSEHFTVDITNDRNNSNARLNVTDQQVVSQKKLIKGASEQLKPSDLSMFIDGEVVRDTYAAVESEAYFVFEATDVDYYFKNGVTIGDEIIHTFLDPLKTYTTIKVPIEAERLALGSNEIAIRAGTKSGPFDERPEENKDDFKIRNVRLILADGTNIYDPLFNDKNAEIKMGDSAGKYEGIEFNFELTAQNLGALAYEWDTTQVADGPHEITLEAGSHEAKATVIVDNTAPVITPSISDNEQFRGEFTLNAQVRDEYAGVKSVQATLNDEGISLPYETSTGKLASGQYTFKVTATDNVGNESNTAVTFTINNENPDAVQVITPANGSSDADLSPSLTVKVTDPQNDVMSLLFKRGFHYDSNRSFGFTAYTGASEVEPPKQKIPASETVMTEDELHSISAVDGEYLTTDSDEQFPYQRFEIELDNSVQATDEVEIIWQGASLEGRKVSMYAWNPTEQSWSLLDSYVAQQADFTLESTVLAGAYNDNGVIHVMIQDEVPVNEDEFDFTFVWMSDTQYYSESYPWIFKDNTQWIADNKEKLDIRYIIHTGDIVDESDVDQQWINANEAMKTIEDANIPYGVLAGNHDVNHQTGDYNKYWLHYGEDRFKHMDTYGGSYQNNRGHYDLVSAGGNDFIIVYMGWNIGDEQIDWVEQVVKDHPDRKAILAFHEYLLVSNNRAPIADEIYERVVEKYPNVFAVLSGHYHDAETLIDEIDDDGDGIPDRKVYQMLADYQGGENGGNGFIRLLQFDLANNQIHVKTYSPYLDQYNYYDPTEYPGKDEFDIELDLSSMKKRVATDYFEVSIHTNQVIGEVNGVESGKEASVNWGKLNENERYEWYVEVTDQHSGKMVSPIWNFTTGEASPVDPTPTPDPTPTTSPVPTPTLKPTQTPSPIDPTPTLVPTQTPGGSGGASSTTQNIAITKDSLGTSNSSIVNVDITTTSGNGNRYEIDISQEVIAQLKANNQSLQLTFGNEIVTLDQHTWDNLGSDDKVHIHVTTLSESELNASNDDAAYRGMNQGLKVAITSANSSNTIKSNGTLTLSFSVQSLDPDLIGVYQVVNGEIVFVGGTVIGDRIVVEGVSAGQYFVAEFVKDFVDIQGHWAERAIEILASKHIIKGTDDEHYSPKQNVKRADFATMIMRSIGFYEPQGQGTFSDVNQAAYYAGFVAKANELGIVKGHNGSFRPSDEVTREEAIVMIMRAYRFMNPDAVIATDAATPFTDMNDVSSWAEQYVREARTLGLIQGKTGNKFDPIGKLTRAELAVMVVNFLSLVNDK